MKKSLHLALPLILLSQLSFNAQNNPACDHLGITGISPVAQFTKLQVTIKNNCDSCASGVAGCVYWEMRAIRIVAPFDTVAASQCHCLQTPDNNAARSYTLNVLKPIPPSDSLRISFTCGQLGCDTLTYSPVVGGLHRPPPDRPPVVYPNPVSERLTISNLDPTVQKVVITNAAGIVLKSITIGPYRASLDVYGFEPGLYFITGYDKKGKPFPTLKFSKD